MWFYIYTGWNESFMIRVNFWQSAKLTFRSTTVYVTFSNFFDILNHRCSRDPYHSIFDASTWYMTDIFFFFFWITPRQSRDRAKKIHVLLTYHTAPFFFFFRSLINIVQCYLLEKIKTFTRYNTNIPLSNINFLQIRRNGF